MILKRVIHPIGQGGFYTETFIGDNGQEVFNAVYDCGSETNKPDLIRSYLNEWLSSNPKKEIDVVFISHLHEDHINGLDDLLKNVKVRYLFLPKLTDEVIIEAYLYNYITTSNLINDGNSFLTNTLLRRYDTRIVEIDPMNDNENNNDDSVSIIDLPDKKEGYRSGTVFYGPRINKDGALKWQYIPFNSPLQSQKGEIGNDAFFSSLKDTKGQVDPQKLMELIKTRGIKECKKIYTHYFGKSRHNTYSMALYSGVKNLGAMQYCHTCTHQCLRQYCKHGCLISPSFLFTGDFEPNKKFEGNKYIELMKNYLDRLRLWDTISGIQIPHHGSMFNYNDELYHYPRIGYISVGSKNNHHHPSFITLHKIRKSGCKPIIVSEDPRSIKREVYDFQMFCPIYECYCL